MNKQETDSIIKENAIRIIKDLLKNTKCTYHDNHINYRNSNFSLSVFNDVTIWNMEIEEDKEICRGMITKDKYFILDELE